MPRVLVVDDLAAQRTLAKGYLQRDDTLAIEFAKNGLEALELIELDPPDLVVTDLEMPVMSGLELVESVREQFPCIPIVLMTNKGSATIAQRAIAEGASSYVPKAHLKLDLLPTVQRILAVTPRAANSHKSIDRLRMDSTFVLDNDLELITTMVRRIRTQIRQADLFHENDCLRVGTALDEAVLNAYYHGNLEVSSDLRMEDHRKYQDLAIERSRKKPYCDRRITVAIHIDADAANFVIRDEGPGFDPNNLPDPLDPEYLERPSGRGLLLMRAFMDNIAYNPTGNEVTLFKRRTREPVAENSRS